MFYFPSSAAIMATSTAVPGTPANARRRRPRRRRQDKPPLTARLVIDDHIKTDVGIISEDLFTDLFPHLQNSGLPFLEIPLISPVLKFVFARQLQEKRHLPIPSTLRSLPGHQPTPLSPRTGRSSPSRSRPHSPAARCSSPSRHCPSSPSPRTSRKLPPRGSQARAETA